MSRFHAKTQEEIQKPQPCDQQLQALSEINGSGSGLAQRFFSSVYHIANAD